MVRRIAFCTPFVLAAVVLLHRNDPADAMELAGSTDLWVWIHVALLAALVMLGALVHHLLRGLDGAAVRVARTLLPVALVSYAAFDSIVGLGTGLLVERAAALGGTAPDLVEQWWSVPSPVGVISAVAQLASAGVFAATAVAHHAAGSRRAVVWSLGAAALTFPLLHVRPLGLLPAGLLLAAVILSERPGRGGRSRRLATVTDAPSACV